METFLDFPANLPSFITNKAYGLGNPRDLHMYQTDMYFLSFWIQ